MAYRPVGMEEQKGRIQRAINLEVKKTQEAMEAFERAKQAEARAKAKRRAGGSLLGGGVGWVFGPAWAALGYALGGAVGDVVYEEDIAGLGGSHHKDMEDALEVIDKMEEEQMFTQTRDSTELYKLTAEREQEEFTDISLGTLAPGMVTDFMTVYTMLKGTDSLKDILATWKENRLQGVNLTDVPSRGDV